MAMQFQAKTEEEIARARLLDKGEYDFEVTKAEDTVSKKTGDAMIKVQLLVFSDSSPRGITDYLIGSMEAKLRHFCDTTGLLPQYQRGTLAAADCDGRTGRCKVGVEEDKEGKYPPKNKILDYCVRPAKPISQPRHEQTGDDKLPF